MKKIVLNKIVEKVIKKIDDTRPGNVNPIGDFEPNKEMEQLVPIVEKLLEAPGIGKALEDPKKIEAFVNHRVEFAVQDELADLLASAGLCEILPEQGQEQKKDIQANKEVSPVLGDDTGNLSTLEDQEKSKIDATEEQDDKKKFAPVQQNEAKTPEIDGYNAQIEQLEEQFVKSKTKEEKDHIMEQEKKIAHERDEKIGKMYYLTPERMLENLEKMNGGRLFKTLFNTPEKRYAIERAYLTCSDPVDLTNPKFLDNRIEQINRNLPEGEKVEGLRGIHMLLLANTYVGYHVEEVNGGQKAEEQEAKMDEKANKTDVHPAMLGFPAFVSDMPESMKQEIRDRGYDFIRKAVADVVLSNDSYTAICVISNMDALVSKGLESLEREAGDDQKGKAVKAYIKTLDDDFRKESKKDFTDRFDFEITFSAEELENDSTRAQTMALLRMMDKSGQENGVNNAIKSVQVDIVVRDTNDVEKVRNIAKSFGDVGTRADINFAIDTSDPAIWNNLRDGLEEVHRTSTGNVNLYEDVSTEQSMAVDREVVGAIQAAADIGISMAVNSGVSEMLNSTMGETIGESIANSLGINQENTLEDGFYSVLAGHDNNDAAVQDLANQINDRENSMSFDEAVYRLAMEADIPFDMAEDLLIDAGAQVLEEDTLDPMQAFYNNGDND